jgi:hypothetical protein
MAGISFNNAKTTAGRVKTDSYKIREGENKVRFHGNIVARYIYWVPGQDGKKSPIECLSFNRETQEFDNKEEDVVKKYFPDLKCEWAYASLCVDMKETEPKAIIFNHKKKLFGQVSNAVADLGDPSDPETGWSVVFNKVKTGPKVFNVEYTLNPLRCSKEVGPLSAEVRAVFEASPPIEEILKRQTPADIEKFIKEVILGEGRKEKGEGIDDEIPEEFDT